jgi:hypothetical protein
MRGDSEAIGPRPDDGGFAACLCRRSLNGCLEDFRFEFDAHARSSLQKELNLFLLNGPELNNQSLPLWKNVRINQRLFDREAEQR